MVKEKQQEKSDTKDVGTMEVSEVSEAELIESLADKVAQALMADFGSDLHHAITVIDRAKVIVIDAARDLLRREEEKTRQLRMAVECVNTGTPRDRRAVRLADDSAILDHFARDPKPVGSAYLAEQTGVTADDLRKALQRLVKSGKLQCSGRGMGAKYSPATSAATETTESAAAAEE